MDRETGEPDGPGPRPVALLALGGSATALVALLLAAATGGPYLSSAGVNPWVVVFAAGLLGGLVAFPFALEIRLRGRLADRDRRWEVALAVWGAASIAVLAVALVAGFDTSTLAGAAGLIAAIEAAIVIATIAVWLLAG